MAAPIDPIGEAPETPYPASFFAPNQEKAIRSIRKQRERLEHFEKILERQPADEGICRVIIDSNKFGGAFDQAVDGLLELVKVAALAAAAQAGLVELSDEQRAAGLGTLGTLPKEMVDACFTPLAHGDLFRLCLVSRAINERALPLMMSDVVMDDERHVQQIRAVHARGEWNGCFDRISSLSCRDLYLITEGGASDILWNAGSSIERLDWIATLWHNAMQVYELPKLKHLVLELAGHEWEAEDAEPGHSWRNLLHENARSLQTVLLRIDYEDKQMETIMLPANYDLSAIFDQQNLVTLTVEKVTGKYVNLRLVSLDDDATLPTSNNLRKLAFTTVAHDYLAYSPAFAVRSSQLAQLLHATPRLTHLCLQVELSADDRSALSRSAFPLLRHLKRVQLPIGGIEILPGLAPSNQLEAIGLFDVAGRGPREHLAVEYYARKLGTWGHAFTGAISYDTSRSTQYAFELFALLVPKARQVQVYCMDDEMGDPDPDQPEPLELLVHRLLPMASTLETLGAPIGSFTCGYRTYTLGTDFSSCQRHSTVFELFFQRLPHLRCIMTPIHTGHFERVREQDGLLCRFVEPVSEGPLEELKVFEFR